MSQSFNDLVRSRSDIAKIAEVAITRRQYRLELALMALLLTAAVLAVVWIGVSALHRFGLAGPMGLVPVLFGFFTIWLWFKVFVRLSFFVGHRAVVREAARVEHAAGP
jgi:hypothetical protein